MEIPRLEQADYRYYLKIPQTRWLMYLAKKGAEVDYPKFKDMVSLRDYARHQTHMNCWSALRRWQDE